MRNVKQEIVFITCNRYIIGTRGTQLYVAPKPEGAVLPAAMAIKNLDCLYMSA